MNEHKDHQLRPETGPLRFSGDWKGIFIRGDNALFFATVLSNPESNPEIKQSIIQGLADLFFSADEHKEPSPNELPVQELKEFNECRKEEED